MHRSVASVGVTIATTSAVRTVQDGLLSSGTRDISSNETSAVESTVCSSRKGPAILEAQLPAHDSSLVVRKAHPTESHPARVGSIPLWDHHYSVRVVALGETH